MTTLRDVVAAALDAAARAEAAAASIPEQVSTVASASGSVSLAPPNVATVHNLKLTGNVTLNLPGAAPGAASISVIVTQDATGGRTITWPATVGWVGGVPPAPSTVAGLQAVFTLFTINGGVTWVGLLAADGIIPAEEPAELTVPAVPGSFTVVPDVDSITASWSAPANGGAPITGYRLYRGTVSGVLTLFQTLGSEVLSYDDTAITPGNPYFYKVRAVNAIGEGPATAEKSATVVDRGTLIAYDDFNRANTAPNGAGLASDGVHIWQAAGSITNFNVVGNEAKATGGDASDFYYMETGESDVAVEVARGSGSGWGSIVVRSNGGFLSDAFRVIFTGNSGINIQGPGMTERSNSVSVPVGALIRVEAIGSNWTVKLNDVVIDTFTNGTGATNTKHGLAFQQQSSTSDNFKVFEL